MSTFSTSVGDKDETCICPKSLEIFNTQCEEQGENRVYPSLAYKLDNSNEKYLQLQNLNPDKTEDSNKEVESNVGNCATKRSFIYEHGLTRYLKIFKKPANDEAGETS